MGKKTKKTRWRTLSIGGEACSDSESQNGSTRLHTNEKNYKTNGLWYNNSSSSSSQKYSGYSSYNSTPIKQQNGGNHQQRSQWNGHYTTRAPHQATSKSTTRSSSTVSEHKITFNEDEYTRITTPRQDVLFKKGYLSKPKPYLQQQRSLTSTGNSTGDGTPDHQSADGNDIIDGEYDQSPFVFPGGGFIDGNNVGMFFVNGFEPYAVPPHHVLVYDQYGNAAVCFPPPQLPPPPTSATVFERRSKRYSTDSMTESTSPHNESNQDATSTDEPLTANDECLSSKQLLIKETPTIENNIIDDCDHDNEIVVEETTTRIRKKRKRKRIERINKEDGQSMDEDLSSELSSLSCAGEVDDDEQHHHHKNDNEYVEDDNDDNDDNDGNDGNDDDDDDVVDDEELKANIYHSTNCKYRVDAEEFVPRSYQTMHQQMEFVSLPVGMPFPGELYAGTFVPTMFVSPPPSNHQIYFNNPHRHSSNATQQHNFTTELLVNDENSTTICDNIETIPIMEATTTTTKAVTDTEIETTKEMTAAPNVSIDIAKIVSKLELAALEQKRVEVTDDLQSKKVNDSKIIETTNHEDYTNNDKTEKTLFNNKKCVPKTTEIIEQKQLPMTVTNVCYSERLKQSQQQKQQQQQQSITTPPSLIKQKQNKLNTNKRRTNQICPRLDRNSTVTTTTISLQSPPLPPPPIAPLISPSTISSNQWISVSGKKKRGKNKQLPSDIVEDFQQQQQQQQQESQLQQQQSQPQQHHEPKESIIHENHIKESTNLIKEEIEKEENKKSQRTTSKNNPKKQQITTITKKRILINDCLVVRSDEEVLTQAAPPSIVVVKNITDQIDISKCNKSQKKRSTKKLNKPKNTINNTNTNNIITNDLTMMTNSDKIIIDAVGVSNKKDDNADDVSLELDRMIQRGLYGNLEQRLRSFNPTDSFIVDVIKQQQQSKSITNDDIAQPTATITITTTTTASTTTTTTSSTTSSKRFDAATIAAASVIGTMSAAVLNKSSNYFGQTSSLCRKTDGFIIAPKVVISTASHKIDEDYDSNTITLQTTSDTSLNDDNNSSAPITNPRFPITQAVREWMNKTRENTPELEIFKKPNEIRQEFLTINHNNDTFENGMEIEEFQNIDDQVIQVDDDDMYGDTVETQTTPIQIAEATDTIEDDLLACWEPDVCYEDGSVQIRRRTKPIQIVVEQQLQQQQQQQQQSSVEQGEDVLETYESVYGHSDDFARIQSEIQQQQQQRTTLLNNNNIRGGIDGALPYRAICCSIM